MGPKRRLTRRLGPPNRTPMVHTTSYGPVSGCGGGGVGGGVVSVGWGWWWLVIDVLA